MGSSKNESRGVFFFKGKGNNNDKTESKDLLKKQKRLENKTGVARRKIKPTRKQKVGK